MDNDLKYIDKLVSGKLQTHAVESTTNSWAKINTRLAWRNFMYFSVGSINVYYVSAFLFATIWGSAIYMDSASNSAMNENQVVADNSININTPDINNTHIESIETIEPDLTSNSQTNLPINNSQVNINPQTQLVEPVISNNKDIVSEKIESPVISENKPQNNIIAEADISDNSNINTEDIQNNINESENVFNPYIIEEKPLLVSNTLEPKISFTDPESPEIAEQTYDLTRYSDINFISPVFLDNMALFPDNNMYPQLRNSDTLEFYKPLSERTAWFIEVYFSPLYTSNITESPNPELKSFIDGKVKIESPVISFTTGLNLIYQGKNNLLFQTGIAYTEYGERIERGYIEQIDNYTIPNYIDGGFFDYDTIPFINIDSLSQGVHYVDTLIESTWIVDNSTSDVSDTTKYKGADNRNRYSYLEFPIIVGYTFPSPRFDFQIKAGIITGVLFNTNGLKQNPQNSLEIIDINSDSPKFRNINYSMVAGFNVNYHILERVNLSTGIMYRKNLFDIYDSYLYSQKHFGTEFHIGIQYRL